MTYDRSVSTLLIWITAILLICSFRPWRLCCREQSHRLLSSRRQMPRYWATKSSGLKRYCKCDISARVLSEYRYTSSIRWHQRTSSLRKLKGFIHHSRCPCWSVELGTSRWLWFTNQVLIRDSIRSTTVSFSYQKRFFTFSFVIHRRRTWFISSSYWASRFVNCQKGDGSGITPQTGTYLRLDASATGNLIWSKQVWRIDFIFLIFTLDRPFLGTSVTHTVVLGWPVFKTAT